MKSDLEIEQARKRLLESYQHQNNRKDATQDKASYWSFFKLRIIFSIIICIASFAVTRNLEYKEYHTIENVMLYMNQQDPYTQKLLDSLETFSNHL